MILRSATISPTSTQVYGPPPATDARNLLIAGTMLARSRMQDIPHVPTTTEGEFSNLWGELSLAAAKIEAGALGARIVMPELAPYIGTVLKGVELLRGALAPILSDVRWGIDREITSVERETLLSSVQDAVLGAARLANWMPTSPTVAVDVR